MSHYKRLKKAYKDALRLPIDPNSRYILMSDCHRGVGNTNDNFLKNQNLYFAALQYYYTRGFTYIELGDGDELWENRSMEQIIEIHNNTFWLLSKFQELNRFYAIYGNHDIVKRRSKFITRSCSSYYCTEDHCYIPLFSEMTYYEGLILEDTISGAEIFLTHGHQADTLNSRFWFMSRFLVRYLWAPLEHIGFLDPTSAARNNIKKDRIECRLLNFALKENLILISGHTHRPMLDIQKESPYLNTGSCIHPRCITAIEVMNQCFTLVKWTYCTRPDLSVAICREVLAGPVCIGEFQ